MSCIGTPFLLQLLPCVLSSSDDNASLLRLPHPCEQHPASCTSNVNTPGRPTRDAANNPWQVASDRSAHLAGPHGMQPGLPVVPQRAPESGACPAPCSSCCCQRGAPCGDEQPAGRQHGLQVTQQEKLCALRISTTKDQRKLAVSDYELYENSLAPDCVACALPTKS
jgi:hypothetical protein